MKIDFDTIVRFGWISNVVLVVAFVAVLVVSLYFPLYAAFAGIGWMGLFILSYVVEATMVRINNNCVMRRLNETRK